MLAGEPFSDRPACVDPVLSTYLRAFNDRLAHSQRQRLLPYAALAVDTRAGRAVERKRSALCLAYGATVVGARTRTGARLRIALLVGVLPALRLRTGAPTFAARCAIAAGDVEGGVRAARPVARGRRNAAAAAGSRARARAKGFGKGGALAFARMIRRAISIVAIAVFAIAAGCGEDDGDQANAAPAATATATATTSPAAEAEPAAAKPAAARPKKRTGTRIKVAPSQFGDMLYDTRGQAIYLFDREKTKRSECYGDCAAAWPPVLTKGRPRAIKGTRRSLLGTTKRRDGTTQVTYKGHPLYFYAHEGPNQVLCHNVREFGGLWLVVKPNGDAAPH